MEHVWKVYICWSKIWEYVVIFCNEYANVATILSIIIPILGACGIRQAAQKCKKNKEFKDEFFRPVRNRSVSKQIDACIIASDNGVSKIEVDENE